MTAFPVGSRVTLRGHAGTGRVVMFGGSQRLVDWQDGDKVWHESDTLRAAEAESDPLPIGSEVQLVGGYATGEVTAGTGDVRTVQWSDDDISAHPLSDLRACATDEINPPHYTAHPSGVECIDVTEAMSFNAGNAVKYIWRAGLKGPAIQDLEKAAWYIAREINRLEAEKKGE